MKVLRSGGCGNSPKNKMCEDFVVAFMTSDLQTLEALAAEDLLWRRPGTKEVGSRKDVLQPSRRWDFPASAVLEIERVVSHGRSGAVSGRILHRGRVVAEFCQLLDFTNLKCERVQSITSYLVEADH